MYDLHDGIIYEPGEEFDVMFDMPVVEEHCVYNHGWAVVKMHAGHVEEHTPPVGYVVVLMEYATKQDGFIPVQLSDMPSLVDMLMRWVFFL